MANPLMLQWMKFINDGVYLSRFTIPGTHDTCTAGAIPQAETQGQPLAQQLINGIRFIDIRCAIKDSSLCLYHGVVDLNKSFAVDAIDICRDFLASNPSETIIMSVKSEHKTDDAEEFSTMMDGVIGTYGSLFYLENSIPTLKQARGKIVLLGRYNQVKKIRSLCIPPASWPDNQTFSYSDGAGATYSIQDQYNLESIQGIQGKWGIVEHAIGIANIDLIDPVCKVWHINFTSAASSTPVITPKMIALGYTTAGIWPTAVKGVHENFQAYLNSSGSYIERFGTIIFDYADEDVMCNVVIPGIAYYNMRYQ